MSLGRRLVSLSRSIIRKQMILQQSTKYVRSVRLVTIGQVGTLRVLEKLLL